MAQFNFGSNAGNTGFSFGTPKPAASAFGAPAATQPAGSITFGTPLATVATQPNTGFSFGTSTPALGQGLAFGTPATSAPGLAFGTPAKTTGISFGTQPAGNLNFNAPATNLSFGATPAASTGPSLSFGTATATPALNFNAPASTATGLTFGTPVSSTNFGLGSNLGATTSASTGLFGTALPTTTQTGLGGLSFNMPTSSVGLSLGTINTTTTSGLLFGSNTTTTTSLGFGLGANTAKAPTLNFSSALTPASTGLNFGFNTPAKSQSTTISNVTPSIGLGGIDSSQSKPGVATVGRVDTLTAKENAVPNEILELVKNFKVFVKQQKTHSSDVSRGSVNPFLRVGEDIDLLDSTLSEVGNELQKNQQMADKLKHDSAKSLHDAEIAQRTFETPPGLQFENNAPLQYFIDLVNQFEQDLHALRHQIDTTDKHIQQQHEPRMLTSHELAQGMKKLHETFVALAGRLHSVHSQVESQKEQYLNLRKYILKDPTNIFMQQNKEEEALKITLDKVEGINTMSPGPTPFSAYGSPFELNITTNVQQTPAKPPPAYPGAATLNFGSSAPSTANFLGQTTTSLAIPTLSLFGSPAQSTTAADAASFQLQNPPLGNKRGKR